MPTGRSTRSGRRSRTRSSAWRTRRDRTCPQRTRPGSDPGHGRKGQVAGVIIRKSAHEIELMAAAGVVVAGTLALLEERLEPGITMAELDRIAEEYIGSQDAVPTSKGYKGFPAATCISPNEMIVHGIPGEYRAKEGDLVSFDIGVTKDGLIADSAATFGVGEISDEAQ